MNMISDLQLGLRLAFKARFLLIGFWLLFGLVVVVFLAAQFSGRQPTTVAMDIGISLIRLLLPIIGILLAQELFSKEFERRFYLTSISYPRPRYSLLLGRFAAIYGLTMALLIAMALVLAIALMVIDQGYAQSRAVSLAAPYLITIGFIAIDVLVLCALATLLAVFASTPSFVLIGTFGFMLIARSYSGIIALLQRDSYLVGNPEQYQSSLKTLSYIIPDLGALDVRMIALYDSMSFIPPDWLLLIVSSLLYTAALLALSLWLLQKRHFN